MVKNPSLVSLSTAESEYCAMTYILQRAIYIQTQAMFFQETKPAIKLYNDMLALKMVKALGKTTLSKFFDLRYQYIRQKIRDTHITLHHQPSRHLSADMFTKALELQ